MYFYFEIKKNGLRRCREYKHILIDHSTGLLGFSLPRLCSLRQGHNNPTATKSQQSYYLETEAEDVCGTIPASGSLFEYLFTASKKPSPITAIKTRPNNIFIKCFIYMKYLNIAIVRYKLFLK